MKSLLPKFAFIFVITSIAFGVHSGWILLILTTPALCHLIYHSLPFVKKKEETRLNELCSLLDDLYYMKRVKANLTVAALREIYFNKRMKKLFSTADIKSDLVLKIIYDYNVVEQIKALIEEARNSYEWKILDDLEITNENVNKINN